MDAHARCVPYGGNLSALGARRDRRRLPGLEGLEDGGLGEGRPIHFSAQRFAHPQPNAKCQQPPRHHFVHVRLALVPHLVQMQQTFQIPKTLFNLHAGKIDVERVRRFQIGHPPERLGQTFFPPPD